MTLPAQDHSAQQPAAAPVRLARRDLMRRGLGLSVPVVATLASMPVSAGTCVVASSFVSAATFASRNPGLANPYACNILTPAALLGSADPNVAAERVKAFSAVFGTTGFAGDASTLAALLSAGGATANEAEVAWRLVWLHLNMTLSPVLGNLPAGYAQSVWTTYRNNLNTYPVPNSAVTWSTADLINYLMFLLGA